jgi:hypothetical protein
MDPLLWQKKPARPAPTDGDDLFSSAAKAEAARAETAIGQAAGERQADTVAPALRAQLVQLMEAIAERNGDVTVADLRHEAVASGLLDAEQPLDFLGTLARHSRRLVATAKTRRSFIPGTHGNRNVVYVLRNGARGAA